MSISLVNAKILINAALNFLSLNSCIRSTYRDFYFNELDANLHYITYFSNLIGINWPGFIASLLWIIFLNWKQEIFIQVTMCNPPERNTKWPRKNVCTVLKLLFKTQKTPLQSKYLLETLIYHYKYLFFTTILHYQSNLDLRVANSKLKEKIIINIELFQNLHLSW